MKLRPYQIEAVESVLKELKTEQTSLMVLATGMGKSIILFSIMKECLRARPDLKIVFVVNKLDLLSQTVTGMKDFFPDMVGEYHGDVKDLSKEITVASIQSIYRINHYFNLAIFDECHRIADKDSSYATFIKNCLLMNERLKIIGCTASPYRYDGYIYGPERLFKKPCINKDIIFGVENGFLVPPITKSMPDKFITKGLKITAGDYNQKELEELTKDYKKVHAQIDNALELLKDRKKCVWACTSIDHAEYVHAEILKRGESSTFIHSKMPDRSTLDKFKTTGIKHLTFVTIVSEGFDHPPVDAVVLMRPTRSPVLMVQTIGRGLRTYDGKEDCLVLDFGGVIENCGPLHAPYVEKKSRPKISEFRVCTLCLSYVSKTAKDCKDCGFVFPVKERGISKEMTTNSFGGSLFHELEIEAEILVISVDEYKAKSGNECIRFSYTTKNIFHRNVFEYFQKWDVKRITARLIDLGLPMGFNGKSVVDRKIKLKKDGKYFKVTQIF